MSANPAAQARRYVDLATAVLARPPSCGHTRLVAVDGPGGSGKSTFAARFATALGGAAVVHTDDFASWDEQFTWWPRLLTQVIEPIRAGSPARYQRFDWVTREFAEWHDLAARDVVVIEGVGAARLEFAPDLALIIWIDTPADLRLRRGIERDGEAMRDFWTRWIEGETRHFAEHGTRGRADLVVSGEPHLTHDPETEFVALTGVAGSPS